MADLSSILGGMVQGFKDFGTGLVDFFGTGAANIGDIASSIATGRATTKNQDDFRKWLYQTEDKQDAAAKGLGTILNGVSTVADVIPGAQAVTANPLFNGIQGAIGGVSDELKMAGKDADWGRAAQRAGVGAASGLASGYAGQGLAKTGNKLLSNGLTRGAISGGLGGGIANAGYTGIEGGSVQDMINAGLYGAQTGALVGGTTGLARELIKPAHKMDVALTDDEKAARIANIDDQISKLDTSTPEGNARYAELTAARQNYAPKTYYHGSPETDITEFDINRAGRNTRSGEKAIYFTDTPEAAEEFAYERIPTDSVFVDKVGKRGGVYEANLDMRNTLDLDNLTDAQIRELWNYASPMGQLDGQEAFVQRLTDWRDKYHNPQLTKGYIDLEALRNSPYDSFSATMYPNTDNKAKEYAIFDASKAKITKSPKTVADLMLDADSGATNRTTPLEQAKAAADSATDAFINKSGRMASDGEINSTFEGAFIKNAKALGASDIEINNELNRLFKTYDVNYTHRNKTVADLMLSPDGDIMAAKVAPGQLGLFDQPTPKTTTAKPIETAGAQISLFDQPEQPVAKPIDVEQVNPYAPVNNEVTDTMRNRASDILRNYKKNGVPENELYNKIDESTLPEKIKNIRELTDKGGYESIIESKLGAKKIEDVPMDVLLDYLYDGDQDSINRAKWLLEVRGTESPRAKRGQAQIKNRIVEEIQRKIGEESGIDSMTNENPVNTAIRSGYSAAADELLSERLGIAPGNTPKYNGNMDTRRAFGRYRHPTIREGGNIAAFEKKMGSPEDAISTIAHERLHSFQGETEPRSNGRYNKEVIDAYNELRKDLGDYYKSYDEIADRYKRDIMYWGDAGEQESRMFQQYLENKGYADSAHMKDKYRTGEWGNEINPAFDKFIDKLRDLSKRGIALPALATLFGGGAIMAATQSDDKKKKSEVK